MGCARQAGLKFGECSVIPSNLHCETKVSFSIRKGHLVASFLILLALALGFVSSAAFASADGLNRGRETGLPLPRFVSLKFSSVNLRVGPGRKYAIKWQYRKQGLPVEVIQEFDQWRRIRDSEGSTGWVLHSQLSNKRTGLVAPWEIQSSGAGQIAPTVLIHGKGSASRESSTVAKLQAGLMVSIEECAGFWCEVEAQNMRFWLRQDHLWGVYPNEVVDG